jgi:hypothetical protein
MCSRYMGDGRCGLGDILCTECVSYDPIGEIGCSSIFEEIAGPFEGCGIFGVQRTGCLGRPTKANVMALHILWHVGWWTEACWVWVRVTYVMMTGGKERHDSGC